MGNRVCVPNSEANLKPMTRNTKPESDENLRIHYLSEIRALKVENRRLEDLVEAERKHREFLNRASGRFTLRMPRRVTRRFAHLREQCEMLARAIARGDPDARAIICRSLGRRVSRVLGRVTPREQQRLEPQERHYSPDDWERYPEWLARFDTLGPDDHAAIEARMASGLPRVAVVVRFSEAHLDAAERVAAALADQMLAPASITVVVAAGTSAAAAAAARAAFGPSQVVRSAADFEGSAGPADATLVMEASHVLRPHATVAFACEFQQAAALLVYPDEDRCRPDGTLDTPFFKPGYSPRFAETGYMGGCGLVAPALATVPALVDRLAGGASVRDLLRALAAPVDRSAVGHLPLPLALDTAPVPLDLAAPDRERLRAVAPATARVSIIIPSRNRVGLLKPCIESILDVTAYDRARYEIIVANNDSDDPETIDFLCTGADRGDFTVIDDQEPFNYPRLNNAAVAQATGDILVFLNNDTLIIQPDWLTRLVDAASVADVGAVGVKLLYADRTVQHAGVVLGIQGVAGHSHVKLDESAPGYQGLATADHEVSAVTGACLAMRRSVFEEVGGFDPAFAVAFNDTVLCLAVLKRGYRNIVLNSVKLIHLESQSRGFDDTPEKRAFFMGEAVQARALANEAFASDSFYNPNLSLTEPYRLAVPPRRRKPWYGLGRTARSVLLLSSTHQIGHGVPIVLAQQARFLVERGFRVFVGGPVSDKDIDYPGCERVDLRFPQPAAIFASENNIDCVIAHTPPFYSVARWSGGMPKIISMDHGEPPPSLFDDRYEREKILSEKAFVFAMADRVCAISPSVKYESGHARTTVIPNANSHLAVWSGDDSERRRVRTRVKNGWERTVVVINVCRFHRAERFYKGVDVFIEAARALRRRLDARDLRIEFLLVGRGDAQDIAFVEQQGLEVRANVTDAEMIDLYAAADLYMNFSKWEGYNLGIAQALAMGLPVLASDIPAHRMNFDISVLSRPSEAAAHVLQFARAVVEADFRPQRRPTVTSWQQSVAALAAEVESVCSGDTTLDGRSHDISPTWQGGNSLSTVPAVSSAPNRPS